MAIFGALRFLPTRNLSWWRAWVFLGVVLVGATVSTVSVRLASPALLEERFKPPVQKGQPLADQIAVLSLIAAFVGEIVFIPLDVFRLHLMARPGVFVSSAGILVFVAGWWVMTLALRANPFCGAGGEASGGPPAGGDRQRALHLVRHPMYAGAITLFVGMPLWLESCAATLLAVVPVGLLVLRIHVEERFLRRELPGYDAYARTVRYRLIPFLW